MLKIVNLNKSYYLFNKINKKVTFKQKKYNFNNKKSGVYLKRPLLINL